MTKCGNVVFGATRKGMNGRSATFDTFKIPASGIRKNRKHRLLGVHKKYRRRGFLNNVYRTDIPFSDYIGLGILICHIFGGSPRTFGAAPHHERSLNSCWGFFMRRMFSQRRKELRENPCNPWLTIPLFLSKMLRHFVISTKETSPEVFYEKCIWIS